MTSPRMILAAVLLAAPLAHAGPGDVYEVTADLVNLRAGPSDGANVRDRVSGGSEVIELRRDGGWLGVRVVETGQEGWIYGELLRRVETSGLDEDEGGAGFASLDPDFDRLIAQVNERLGVDMIGEVAADADTLTVTPTESWLRRSSQEAQVLAATSIYQMWKHHHDDAPVRVVLQNAEGGDYVVLDDEGEEGPTLTVIDEASGREG